MKKRMKGTPHPRHRKPLEIITNRQHSIASHPHVKKETHKKECVSVEANADDQEAATPLRRLHAVHGRLTKLLQKIDAMVAGAHKMKLAGKLEVQELNKFVKAISNIENNLQEWDNVLAQAANRPNAIEESSLTLIPIQPMHELSINLTNECILSSSPLVPSSWTDTIANTRTMLLFHTPDPPPLSSTRKHVTFATNSLIKSASTPSLATLDLPAITSPPRSVSIRRPSLSTSISSSCPSTPSLGDYCKSRAEECEDLATPRPPLEIIAKYPKWFEQFPSSGRSRSRSPSVDAISPPKTCALMRPSPGSSSCFHRHSALTLKSPALTLFSPFHTPGLVLRLPRFGENSYSDEEIYGNGKM